MVDSPPFFKFIKIMTNTTFHKVSRLGLDNSQMGKILTISYKSCSVDDTYYYIDFSITSKGLENKQAVLLCYEHNHIYSNTSVGATKVTLKNGSASYEIKIKKSVIDNLDSDYEYDGFEFRGEITCDGLSHTTNDFRLSCSERKKVVLKKVVKELPLKTEYCNPIKLTDEQKNEFIATSFCESGLGEWELRDVTWIYFNLVSSLNFQTALNRSAAHKEENIWYKTCMCYITNKAIFKNDNAPSYARNAKTWFGEKTYGDFVDSKIFKNNYKDRIDKLKKYIETEVFIDKPKQKYKGWYGQGYWGDMLIIDGRDKGKWHKARQYYWLQLKGEVSKKYVQILISKARGKAKNLTAPWQNNTTFIYHENEILKYFENNPKKLPKTEKIKSFKKDNINGTFDLEFKLK